MASRKTVTLDNLVALGPERLAGILTELAEGDAEVKRRLRLELAAQSGGDTIAAEIGKRITALRSAHSFIDWQKRRDFVKDLDLQRAMIVDRVARTRADLALDLMWRSWILLGRCSAESTTATARSGIPTRAFFERSTRHCQVDGFWPERAGCAKLAG